MRVSFLYVAGSFLSLIAAQQPTGPNPFTLPPGFMITAGQQTTITWTPTAGGTVSIRLRQGASSNLEEGTVIACKGHPLPTLPVGARALTHHSEHWKQRQGHNYPPRRHHSQLRLRTADRRRLRRSQLLGAIRRGIKEYCQIGIFFPQLSCNEQRRLHEQ